MSVHLGTCSSRVLEQSVSPSTTRAHIHSRVATGSAWNCSSKHHQRAQVRFSLACSAQRLSAVCPPQYGACSARHPSRHQRRCAAYASNNSASTVSSSLISVLKDELTVAREAYRQEEELLEEPPNDFQLDNPAGKAVFYLMKEYENEQVIIEVDLDAQPRTDDEESEEESAGGVGLGSRSAGSGSDDVFDSVPPIAFKVQVSKGSRALVFECESNGEYITIEDLRFEDGEDEDDTGDDDDDDESEEEGDSSDEPYRGPHFEELDDTLQQAFLDYLEERGVTPELCEYIRLMVKDKADLEYQAWLRRVRDFVAADE